MLLRRTIWAIVGGRLVEYDITGKLLREVVLSRMQSYGLAGVTSMAWVKKHHLLLGMRKGNRIALVDVAPDPPTDNRADFDYYDYEPPGPEEEEDLIRERNLLEVVSVMTVAPKLLPSDSLGAISYNTLDNTVVFSSSRSPLDGVFMMSLDDGDNDDDDGGTPLPVLFLFLLGRRPFFLLTAVCLFTAPVSGKMMSGTGLSDIASLEGVLYAPRTENFLMWCGSCAEAHEVWLPDPPHLTHPN